MALVRVTTATGSPTYPTLRAAYLAHFPLTKDHVFEIDTAEGEDVGAFWTNGAFENYSSYSLTIKGKDGSYGILKSTTADSALFLENINNVYLQDLKLISVGTGLASLRLKACSGVYASNIIADGGKYSVYIESSISAHIKNLVTQNITVEQFNFQKSTGITIENATFGFVSGLNTASLTPIRISYCSYTELIGIDSDYANNKNHMKIVSCDNFIIDRSNFRNAKGHAIYAQSNKDFAVRNSIIWDNGTVEDQTSAIFVEGGDSAEVIGNTIKHQGYPLAYAVYLRNGVKNLVMYNNICMIERRSGAPTVNTHFLRLDMDATWAAIECNNNLYYAAVASRMIRGKVGNTSFDYASLASFSAGTGKDTNSVVSVAAPTFQADTFLLTSSSAGRSIGNPAKGTKYTFDFKERTSVIDVGAYDYSAITPVFTSIAQNIKAIDLVTGVVHTSAFTAPAYNPVLFIADNHGFPDNMQMEIEGIADLQTIGRYKKVQWNLDSGFGVKYDVVITATKSGFTDSVVTDADYVTIVRRLPVPSFYLSEGNHLMYLGESVTFTNDSTDGDTYVWRVKRSGSVVYTTTTEDLVNYIPSSMGIYTVELEVTNTSGVRTRTIENILQVTNETIVPRVTYDVSSEVINEGETVQFTSTTSGTTECRWEFPGGTPSVSYEDNPIVTYKKRGDYDVKYSAVFGTSVISTFQRRKISCLPVLNGTVHTITLTGLSKVTVNGAVSGLPVMPGDIIEVQGNGEFIEFKNIIGTPESPVMIRNVGKVNLVANDQYYALRIGANCANVILNGKNDPDYEYGFYLRQPDSNNLGSGTLQLTARATDIEILGVEVDGSAFAGIMAKTDDAANPRTAFTMYNLRIHRNYVHNVRGEGMYLGHFTWHVDNAVAPGYLAPEMHNTKVFRNRVHHTFNDGIQLGCGRVGSEIHDNYITEAGVGGAGGQNSALSVNTGFVGYVYNNICVGAENGGSIVAQPQGNTYIFGNTFAGIAETNYGIYGKSDITTGENIEVIIANNTILSKSGGVVYNYEGGNKWGKLVVQNNIIVINPASKALVLFGIDAVPNLVMTKNLTGDINNTDSYLFYFEEGGDLRVGPGSIAMQADGDDIYKYVTLPWGRMTDQSGLMLPLNIGWTYGGQAIAGYNDVPTPPILPNDREGLFYKIMCSDGWQKGFAVSEEFINSTTAPENPEATTHPDTLYIYKNTSKSELFPTKKYENFGLKGEVVYNSSEVAFCVQDGVWLRVKLSGTEQELNWNNIVGRPEHTPDEIDAAVAIAGTFFNKKINGAGLADKVIPQYDLASDEWKLVSGMLVGTKLIDESGIGNGKILEYNSTSGKLEYKDKPVSSVGTGGGITQGSGDVISFDTSKIYGTPTSPINNNLTFNLSSAVLGTTVIVIHKSGSVPTLPDKAQLLDPTGEYDNDTENETVNYLTFRYINNDNIIYDIRTAPVGITIVPEVPLDTPTSFTVAPVASSLRLNWVDSNITSRVQNYIIERSISASGPFTTLATVPPPTLQYDDSTVTAGTTYYYRLKATVAAGLTGFSDSGYSTIQNSVVPVDVLLQTIKINCGSNLAAAPWNNPGTAFNSAAVALNNTTGAASGITARGSGFATASNGQSTYTGSAPSFPDDVISTSFTSTTSRTIVFTGNPGKKYKVRLIGSRSNASAATAPRETIFTINSESYTLECFQNSSVTVDFTTLIPLNGSNQFTLTVAPGAGGNSYVNGIIIEEWGTP